MKSLTLCLKTHTQQILTRIKITIKLTFKDNFNTFDTKRIL